MPLSRVSPQQYQQQLDQKAERIREQFADLDAPELEVHSSPPLAFRMRAEFRIWHEGDDLFYAMFRPDDRKTPVRIDHFPIADERIQKAMGALLDALRPNAQLRRKLFQVEFLASLSGELLITLIYHRALDDHWQQAASVLADELGALIIGRSRKQKLVISRDYITETLPLASASYHYRQYEQGFTQPNARVNIQMINWACAAAKDCCANGSDLLELYCGNGNFTLPLAKHYREVIATEVAKSSIRAALHNCELNRVENVRFIRLAAEEVCKALDGVREFRRLKDLPRALADYNFSTVFVDPPRAGLDPSTEQLVQRFDNILYISCNPQTLHSNLQRVTRTHRLQKLAIFDQFAYTDHIECGALLTRRC
jgi:tRNA (uracil-5-)-methyltransferase